MGNLGIAYSHLGNYEKAIECYAEALRLGREIGDRRTEASSLGNLGTIYAENLRKYHEAIDYLQQAASITNDINDLVNEGNWLGNLGLVYSLIGEYQRALHYHNQSLLIAKQVNNLYGQGEQLANLGLLSVKLGKYEQGLVYYKQARDIFIALDVEHLIIQIDDNIEKVKSGWRRKLAYFLQIGFRPR